MISGYVSLIGQGNGDCGIYLMQCIEHIDKITVLSYQYQQIETCLLRLVVILHIYL